MKLETTLNELKSIYHSEDSKESRYKLFKLIEKMADELTADQFKKTNDKTRFNHVKKYLKRIKETRQVLKFIKDDGDVQRLTDTLTLFHLRGDLMFQPLPAGMIHSLETAGNPYPETDSIMNRAKADANLETSIDALTLKKALNRAGLFVTFEIKPDFYMVFDKIKLKDAFIILKYGRDDVFTIKTKEKTFNNHGLSIITAPAYINRRESESLVMPIKADSDGLDFLQSGTVFTFNELNGGLK